MFTHLGQRARAAAGGLHHLGHLCSQSGVSGDPAQPIPAATRRTPKTVRMERALAGQMLRGLKPQNPRLGRQFLCKAGELASWLKPVCSGSPLQIAAPAALPVAPVHQRRPRATLTQGPAAWPACRCAPHGCRCPRRGSWEEGSGLQSAQWGGMLSSSEDAAAHGRLAGEATCSVCIPAHATA